MPLKSLLMSTSLLLRSISGQNLQRYFSHQQSVSTLYDVVSLLKKLGHVKLAEELERDAKTAMSLRLFEPIEESVPTFTSSYSDSDQQSISILKAGAITLKRLGRDYAWEADNLGSTGDKLAEQVFQATIKSFPHDENSYHVLWKIMWRLSIIGLVTDYTNPAWFTAMYDAYIVLNRRIGKIRELAPLFPDHKTIRSQLFHALNIVNEARCHGASRRITAFNEGATKLISIIKATPDSAPLVNPLLEKMSNELIKAEVEMSITTFPYQADKLQVKQKKRIIHILRHYLESYRHLSPRIIDYDQDLRVISKAVPFFHEKRNLFKTFSATSIYLEADDIDNFAEDPIFATVIAHISSSSYQYETEKPECDDIATKFFTYDDKELDAIIGFLRCLVVTSWRSMPYDIRLLDDKVYDSHLHEIIQEQTIVYLKQMSTNTIKHDHVLRPLACETLYQHLAYLEENDGKPFPLDDEIKETQTWLKGLLQQLNDTHDNEGTPAISQLDNALSKAIQDVPVSTQEIVDSGLWDTAVGHGDGESNLIVTALRLALLPEVDAPPRVQMTAPELTKDKLKSDRATHITNSGMFALSSKTTNVQTNANEKPEVVIEAQKQHP